MMRPVCCLCLTLLLLVGNAGVTCAQAPAVAEDKPAPVAKKLPAPRYRKLISGVEITIPINEDEADTYSRHDVVEVLQGIPQLGWQPHYSPTSQTLKEMATNQTFRRDIWYLELTFKPVRMISVDVPTASGKLQRKLVWYLLYHVKNKGNHLHPVKQADGSYRVERIDAPVTFYPQFVLEAPEFDNKAYLDRVVPAAVEAIRKKEDPNREILDSVAMSERPIPVSTADQDRSVWGVAVWEDVDPRIDFFSIFVQGLTNAYHWQDTPGGFKATDPPATGRIMTRSTLQLNFWRPGDEFRENEREIHFGTPSVPRAKGLGMPEVDYQWLYR